MRTDTLIVRKKLEHVNLTLKTYITHSNVGDVSPPLPPHHSVQSRGDSSPVSRLLSLWFVYFLWRESNKTPEQYSMRIEEGK